MPDFRYECSSCKSEFDEFRPMKSGKWSIDQLREQPKDVATCPKCGQENCERTFAGTKLQFTGTEVTSAEFNPGLGCVVKNKRHKEYIMKSKGVVEVGNDFKSGGAQQDHYETRKREERDKKWESV